MSDITMCPGTGCPLREKCYRFTAKDDGEYQSWFTEIPGKWKEIEGKLGRKILWKCDMFWGDRNESIMNKLNEIMK